ncbi:isoleucine--tRNA ligase [Elioraea tepidiphila]|jgi:isoleucyl-tRNA synthetase|uniref:isoleucine--tRNA ligase n=1 Tax=Elioraea tepidiphila TaxID=457934 RepID=UPI002FDA08C8
MSDSKRDYRDTVFLPATAFPMRGELPRREPALLERWARMDLWARLRAASKGREKFVLHDGPPYANGNIHMGTALNKVLKDVINRAKQMAGYDANYVPGWDCHGLPIEWKIEEQYRAAGRDKDAVDPVAFRAECRAYAEHWLGVQREEFIRLGVAGDWWHPYSTMDFRSEAIIAGEIGKFLLNGSLYRGAKPVLWSPVEKTALADAEVEYHDHKSTTVWVKFPIVSAPAPDLVQASIVIWTTTPWTIPGNRAVAYGEDIDYALVVVEGVAEGASACIGEHLLVALPLWPEVEKTIGVTQHVVRRVLKGRELAGTVCVHPLKGKGYDFDVPALPGDFVTTEAGTGFVHIAPGHGEDDWQLGQAHGLPTPDTVGGDGLFLPHVPLFAGVHVYKAADPVCAALAESGALLARGTLVHAYPHSWRSKAPLIFRNTPQWFIAMDGPKGVRTPALAAIEATRFVPAQGQNRLRAMIASRPDWCISRQRAWGVPIAIFVDRRTGEPLRDPKVMARTVAIFETEGSDAWWTRPAQDFLGNDYNAEDYEQIRDIVEVWFESGSTHAFVLEGNDALKWPADLYLEGSDQHRGWFQSSLLEACGTRGRAPYDAILTHGFVVDEQGRKMSKSLGNTVAPQEVIAEYGADILRLWVMASDYTEDLRIGKEILKQQAELYRRIRNTLRWLLGALDAFDEAERVPVAEMPELERWVLHRLAELDGRVREATETFEWTGVFAELHGFCATDLSAFYFDIRKDALYCDRADSPRRRACRTVLDHVFRCLVTWLAPVLVFTAEEAWLARFPGEDESVHLQTFPAIPPAWRDEALAARWARIREIRRVVTGALERERAEGRIGASLQAAPLLVMPEADRSLLDAEGWAEICITSAMALDPSAHQRLEAQKNGFSIDAIPGVFVLPGKAAGLKCERCWKVLPEVGSHADHPGLCDRCHDAVTSGVLARRAA